MEICRTVPVFVSYSDPVLGNIDDYYGNLDPVFEKCSVYLYIHSAECSPVVCSAFMFFGLCYHIHCSFDVKFFDAVMFSSPILFDERMILRVVENTRKSVPNDCSGIDFAVFVGFVDEKDMRRAG